MSSPHEPRRVRVLAFMDYYLPGYKGGGPVRAVQNLVAAARDRLEFAIVTRDRDLGDAHPYSGASSTWQAQGNARVRYLGPSRLRPDVLARIIRQTPHDVVYINSMFSRLSVLVLLLRWAGMTSRRPLVLAPRGEFAAAALRLHARRKRIYLRLGRTLGLFRDVWWQASSELEHGQILATGLAQPQTVFVAPELPAAVPMTLPTRPPKQVGHARVAFVSRVVPMKNLAYALGVLERVRARIDFEIHGPIEDPAYWRECEAALARLPDHVATEVCGSLPQDQVINRLSQVDLLFLPTRGENFGHVVLEALSAGCPVLLSDRTPWRNLREQGIGWDLPLDEPAAMARVIEEVARMDDAAHTRWRDAGRSFARTQVADTTALDANLRLLCAAAGVQALGTASAAAANPVLQPSSPV